MKLKKTDRYVERILDENKIEYWHNAGLIFVGHRDLTEKQKRVLKNLNFKNSNNKIYYLI